MSSKFPRRDFLRSTLAVSAGSLMIPYWFGKSTAGAAEPTSKNDRFRLALIGCGDRGMDIGQHAASFGDYVAVVDLDRNRAAAAKAHFGGKADVYQNHHEVIDRQDIDAVICAVPDHWHTAINIAVCKSGKDLYTEKPLTLTIDEGKILCRVVEETKRVVQVGTMQRSQKCFQTAVELVRNGRIGKLQSVIVTVPFFNTKGGPFQPNPVPSELNWDMYQGQTPLHDYCPQRTHHDFRWWYEYAGGIATDWGNHHLDIAHWGMDADNSGPSEVEGQGEFPPKDAVWNTCTKYRVTCKYPNDITLIIAGGHKDIRGGTKWIGTEGWVWVDRGGYDASTLEWFAKLPDSAKLRLYKSDNHQGNFIDCVRSRKPTLTPVETAHHSAIPGHLGLISMLVGRKIKWDNAKEVILSDSGASALLTRPYRDPYKLA
jgi:predicted dehydrogenase